MGSQSYGKTSGKYVAYKPERLRYSAENYTQTPHIPEMPKYNPGGRNPKEKSISGYAVVEGKLSILQRFIASMRKVGGNLKKRILNFFRRDKKV